MQNYATEQIFAFVRSAKENAARAQQEYDRAAADLQYDAAAGIDLFGGDAVSRVADIASTARRICDKLYAELQTQITMLDAQCRPLLELQPHYRAVREVSELIAWLNRESEIENNFTASLNDHSLGGVASGRYIPSMECRKIESYWQTKCVAWPCKEEAEKADRRVDDLVRQHEQKIKDSNQTLIDSYYAAKAQWQAECERIRKQCSAEVNERIQNVQLGLEQAAKETYDTAVQQHQQTLAQANALKAKASAALEALGLFQTAEKKEQKARIERAAVMAAQANAGIAAAKQQYDTALAEAQQKARRQESFITAQVEKGALFPERPALPRIEGTENQNAFYMQALLDGMQRDVLYTPADLIAQIPELAGLTPQRVSAYLRRLVENYQVERVEQNRVPHFRLY